MLLSCPVKVLRDPALRENAFSELCDQGPLSFFRHCFHKQHLTAEDVMLSKTKQMEVLKLDLLNFKKID